MKKIQLHSQRIGFNEAVTGILRILEKHIKHIPIEVIDDIEKFSHAFDYQTEECLAHG